ncbi:MAG: large-conductance mechanosensitive channel protein MscL [Phycisphaera sp.]|nr:large-conductance mechanosensitive channel protein MscL [Phycisphaera sp.]
MGFIQEFKEFAVKGNALDMAVGIILGAAFNKVVQSIVNDLIMPPIGLMIGGVDFKNLKLVLKQGVEASDAGPAVAEVAIRYGMTINIVIEFLIVAFSVFCIVKFMNKLIKKREAEAK